MGPRDQVCGFNGVYGHGLFVEGLQRVSNLDTRHPPPNASPSIVSDKVMMPADLKRLHKYMLDVEHIGIISDEMRAVVEELWPELAHKLPPKVRRG